MLSRFPSCKRNYTSWKFSGDTVMAEKENTLQHKSKTCKKDFKRAKLLNTKLNKPLSAESQSTFSELQKKRKKSIEWKCYSETQSFHSDGMLNG